MHVDPHEVLIHALELLDDLEGHKWMPRARPAYEVINDTVPRHIKECNFQR